MKEHSSTSILIADDYVEKDFDEKDFRDLDMVQRKIFIQRFIDLIIYDPAKFQIAKQMLKKWESKNKLKF